MNFNDKVVYQIYPKSFKDSNNDGIGDLNGVIEKLDYLKELGIDYIWLTPFFISPQKDNGYDVADYENIDPLFGNFEILDKLIKEAKARNIGLMFDMVFNHTSTEHEWFKKALAGDKKYQDYYIFRDGTKDKVPTNWQSKFGGSAWEYVESLGKWYLHLFDKTQADLNWDNPLVRDEMKKIIEFWKAKGISGFRFDVVNLISKPEAFEDDFIGDGRRFYTDGPRIHEYLKELVADTGIESFITVGEMSSTSLDNCVRYANPAEKELAMVFTFHHLKVDYKDGDKWALAKPDYKALKDLFVKWQEGMQAGNANQALFWCNHDQPRIVSRLGVEDKKSAKMLANVIHFMRGTPYIYQGEEIGMTNAHFDSIDKYVDVESTNYYDILKAKGLEEKEILHIIAERSRDNSRTPMQWNTSENAGFSEAKPWLSVADNYKTINVEEALKDKDSVFYHYKKLVELRKTNKAMSFGKIEFIDGLADEVLGYKRSFENQELVIFNNFVDKEQVIDFDDTKYNVLLSNYDDLKKEDSKIVLRAYESIVFENK